MKHRLLLVSIAAFLVSVSLPAIPITWETTLEAYRGRYSEIRPLSCHQTDMSAGLRHGRVRWDSS